MNDKYVSHLGVAEVYPNSTYLANTKQMPVTPPIGGGTMGVLMLISTLQFQAPYMNSVYSNAASQAGHAAFIQSGGQAIQDKASAKVESTAKQVIRDAGITDTQLGVVLGGAKVVRDRQIDVNGPKVYFVHTHVTVAPDHGAVGLRISF